MDEFIQSRAQEGERKSRHAFDKLRQAFGSPQFAVFSNEGAVNLLDHDQFHELKRNLTQDDREELLICWQKDIQRTAIPLQITNALIFAFWSVVAWQIWAWINSPTTKLSHYDDILAYVGMGFLLVLAHYLSKLTKPQSERLKIMRDLFKSLADSERLHRILRKDREERNNVR